MYEHATPFRLSKGTDLADKLRATKAVLKEREAELLELKGPCTTEECPLHYAHRGPCDVQ